MRAPPCLRAYSSGGSGGRLERDAPLLAIDRTALALSGRPVEWRTSLCDTRDQVYSVTLA